MTRSMTGDFSFQNMCFLCGQVISELSKDMRKVLSGDNFDCKMKAIICERGCDSCRGEWTVLTIYFLLMPYTKEVV